LIESAVLLVIFPDTALILFDSIPDVKDLTRLFQIYCNACTVYWRTSASFKKFHKIHRYLSLRIASWYAIHHKGHVVDIKQKVVELELQLNAFDSVARRNLRDKRMSKEPKLLEW